MLLSPNVHLQLNTKSRLETHFANNNKPNASEISAIASELGVSTYLTEIRA